MVLYVCLSSLKPIKYQIREIYLSCGATIGLCQPSCGFTAGGTGSRSGQADLDGHWSFLGLRGYLVWLTRAHSREVVGDGKTLLWAAVSSEPWQSAGSTGSSSGEHYRNLFGITAPREFRSNSRIYWLFISEKGSILLVPTGKKFLSLQKLQSVNPSSAKWTLSQNMLTFPA